MSYPTRTIEVEEPATTRERLPELSPGLQELVRQGKLTPAKSFTARLPLPPPLPPGAPMTASEALDELRSED